MLPPPPEGAFEVVFTGAGAADVLRDVWLVGRTMAAGGFVVDVLLVGRTEYMLVVTRFVGRDVGAVLDFKLLEGVGVTVTGDSTLLESG